MDVCPCYCIDHPFKSFIYNQIIICAVLIKKKILWTASEQRFYMEWVENWHFGVFDSLTLWRVPICVLLLSTCRKEAWLKTQILQVNARRTLSKGDLNFEFFKSKHYPANYDHKKSSCTIRSLTKVYLLIHQYQKEGVYGIPLMKSITHTQKAVT